MRRDENQGRLEILDGLRGLAIALVVLFHFWQKSWWNPLERFGPLECLPRRGYLGVELFFFLSGFCLYWPVARSGKVPIWHTYFQRRALKIVPSYLLCLLAALLLLPEKEVLAKPLLHLATHLTFLHPFTFETYYSIHGVFWSLGVEVQFYVLFPFLATLFIRRPLYGPLLGWVVLALIAFFYRRWVVQGSTGGIGYTMLMNQLPGVLELFGGGMATATLVVALRQRIKPHLVWSLLVLAGLAALLWLCRSFDASESATNSLNLSALEKSRGGMTYQASIRLPFALALLVTTVGGALTPLSCGLPLRFLATLSYNLYLWHTLLGVLLQKEMGVEKPWEVTDLGLRVRFTLVAWAVSLVVSTILTYGFELPLLRARGLKKVPTSGDAGHLQEKE